MWKVLLTEEAAEELQDLPADQRAKFNFIRRLIEQLGIEKIRQPHVDHISGDIWEMRMKGASGISRALYVTRSGERIVVVRVFVKKTQKTPNREVQLAKLRAKDVS